MGKEERSGGVKGGELDLKISHATAALILLLSPQMALEHEEQAGSHLLLPFSEVSRSPSRYGYILDSWEVREGARKESWRQLSQETQSQVRENPPRPSRVKLPRQSLFQIWDKKQRERAKASLQPARTLSSHPRSMHHALDLAKQVLTEDQCDSSDFLLKLGLELEESFPQSSARVLAEQVYSKSLACAQDEYALVSGYRLAMMLIWREDYERALKIFEVIERFSDGGDLALRIKFWQAYCARLTHQVSTQMRFDGWILTRFPLSLYAHTVSLPTIKKDYLDFDSNENPSVALRPQNNLLLSSLTRRVETLLLSGDQDQAASLLIEYTPWVQQESSEFRLYWSILLDRSGRKLKAYQNILNLIRGDSRRFSRALLEFLYPIEHLETIQNTHSELDPLLLLSLIRQESVFDSKAISPARAYGLMQLQVPTARLFHSRVSRHDLFRSDLNIAIGAKYLNQLIHSYNGSIELALAAYNAGPTRLKKWRIRYPVENPLLFLDLLPVKETREYVSSILRNYYFYQTLYPHEYERIEHKAKFSSVQFE